MLLFGAVEKTNYGNKNSEMGHIENGSRNQSIIILQLLAEGLNMNLRISFELLPDLFIRKVSPLVKI